MRQFLVKKLNGISKSQIVRDSFLVFVLTVFNGLVNYGSQMVMSRSLTVAEFGLINILFSVILICNAPTNTLVAFVSKKTTETTDDLKLSSLENFMTRIFNTIHFVFLILLMTLFAFQSVFQTILKIDFGLLLILVFFVLINFYISVFLGYLAGRKKFLVFGLILVIVPVFKLVTILLFFSEVLKNLNRPSVILLSMCLGAVFSFFVLRRFVSKLGLNLSLFKVVRPQINLSGSKTTVLSLFLTLSMLLFLNLDVLLLNQKFGNTLVGYYSGSLLFARMVYFFVASLVTVLVPNLSVFKKNSSEQIRLLNKSLLATGVLTIVLLLPINLVPSFFINLFLGTNFANSLQFLAPASTLALITSILTILMNFSFVTNQMTFLLVTVAIALITSYLFIYFTDLSAPHIIYVLAIVGLGLCVINYCFFQYKKFKSRSDIIN